MTLKLSALRTHRTLLPRNIIIIIIMFLVLSHHLLNVLLQISNKLGVSNLKIQLIGYRTRNLPVCSVVP
jgi:hypothetical protein